MKARGLGAGQERFKDCFRDAAGAKFLEAMRAEDITKQNTAIPFQTAGHLQQHHVTFYPDMLITSEEKAHGFHAQQK